MNRLIDASMHIHVNGDKPVAASSTVLRIKYNHEQTPRYYSHFRMSRDIVASPTRFVHRNENILQSINVLTADSCPPPQLTSKLVQRLLDSHIMKSCSQVFEAFDETLMFRYETRNTPRRV
jgi:hypothetical protein